jgi:polar amino acid transport system substrate-binding protein
MKTLGDLNDKIVAVQLGTVQDTYVTTLPGVTVKRFQKFDDCVREVVIGRADATLMDRPVAMEFTKAKDFEGKISIAFDQEITGAGKALAIRLDDGAFLDAVNGVLISMKDSGKLEEMRGKWMTWKD